MSYSISTLLPRNLLDLFGENDPARQQRPSTRLHRRLRVLRAQGARSRVLPLTRDIGRLPGPRNRAMAGGSNGSRAALVRLQLTSGLISYCRGRPDCRCYLFFDRLP
jgi:hypothetical protein